MQHPSRLRTRRHRTPALSFTLVAALTLSLAACATQTDTAPDAAADNAASAPTPAEPAPAMTEQACMAEAANSVIGQVATPDVIEQARTAAGAAVARTLAPGQVVTMEYRGDRLNLDVDEHNVVTGVRCG